MVDEKDRAILHELKTDARQTTKRIAQTLGIPRITVHDRIKRLVERGVIKRFTVDLDFAALGLPVTAFVLVSFLPNPNTSQRKLAHEIARLKNITEVQIISGEWDLLLKVRAPSLEAVGELIIDKLRNIEGVGRTTTCACFHTVKDED